MRRFIFIYKKTMHQVYQVTDTKRLKLLTHF